MDIVMRALPSAYGASYDALHTELDTLRARLIHIRNTADEGPDSPGRTGRSSTP
jgi:hypothetical protein